MKDNDIVIGCGVGRFQASLPVIAVQEISLVKTVSFST